VYTGRSPVNELRYSHSWLRAAISNQSGGSGPLSLLYGKDNSWSLFRALQEGGRVPVKRQ
jgi:hypothetical protein